MKNITKKLIIRSLIIFIVFTIGVNAFIAWDTYNNTLSAINSQLKSSLELRYGAMQRQIEQFRKNAIFLASVPPISGITRAAENKGIDLIDNNTYSQWEKRLITIFQGYINSNNEVRMVRLIGLKNHGRELVRVERKKGQIIVVPQTELQSKESSDFLKKTITSVPNKTYVSKVELNREHGKIEVPSWATYRVSTPIFGQNGALFGILIINIDTYNLFQSMLPVAGENIKIYLLNEEGDFLIHEDKNKTFLFDYGRSWRWQNQFQFMSHVSPYQNVEEYNSSTGIVYALKKRITFNNDGQGESLSLIVTMPRSLLTDAITSAIITATLLILIASALVFGLFYIFISQRQKLLIQQARMESIINSIQDAVIGRSIDGTIEVWNHAAEQMFDYPAHKVIGRKVNTSLFSSEATAKDSDAIAKLLKGESVEPFDIPFKNRNNEKLFFSVSAVPIHDNNGTVIGFANTIRNVTAERNATQKIHDLNVLLEHKVQLRTKKLKALNALYQAISNNAGSAIITTGIDGLITTFNPAAEKMLGYRAHELIGKETPEIWHDHQEVEERAAEYSQQLGEHIKPGFDVFVAKTRNYFNSPSQWTLIDKNGSRITVMLTLSALRNNKDQLEGYMGIATDISQLAQTQKELAHVSKKLNDAAKLAKLGIWIWDLQSNNLTWNDHMFEMYGYPIEMKNSDINYEHWRSRLHPDDVQKTESILKNFVSGKEAFNRVFRIVLPNKQVRYIQAGAQIEKDEFGNNIAVTGMNIDITEQFEHERLLNEAKEKADAANIAKSAFLANMSHEIRTPMNAIFGFLQLLQKTNLNQRQSSYLSKLETSSQMLLGILNDILDLSKIESGKLILDKQPMIIEQLLDNLSPILSLNIGNKNLEVIFNIDPTLPTAVFGDALRLQQILLNLTNNAIKFTEKGEVTITIKKIWEKKDQAMVEFAVKDTGIGLSPEQCTIIFESFVQAETSTTRRFGGTGLGLAICQRLVRLMGGELSVESKLKQGSTFRFSIPFKLALKEKNKVKVNTFNSLNCLIVDDHAGARRMIYDMLSSFGWRIEEAASGEEAIAKSQQALNTAPFDIIYMDWRMPGLDGLETSRRICQLQLSETGKTPIIIMVTAADAEAVMQYKQEFPTILDGLLVKPVTGSMLFDAVADAYEIKGGARLTSLNNPKHNLRLQDLNILVVEDNPTNRQVAQELLINEGAKVTTADSGLVGVATIKQAEPTFDVVLMDIQMPEMDGYAATREIRKIYDKKQLPIIAMTANALSEHRVEAAMSGMNDFICKPFNIDEVVSTLLQHTRKTEIKPLDTLPASEVNQSQQHDFDEITAIKRFGGDEQIYYRSLANFIDDVKIQLELLPLSTENVQLIDHALHTIKGIASTVGANAFATIATDIRHKIKNVTNLSKKDWLKLRAKLNDAAEKALDTAQKLLADFTQQKPIPTKENQPDILLYKEQLLQFIALLEAKNMKAIDYYDQLQHPNTVPTDSLTMLDKSMAKLDFVQATKYCHELLRHLSREI